MSGQAVLSDVEVLVFDVFGTVANWRSNVVKQLVEIGKKYSIGPSSPCDWSYKRLKSCFQGR